MPDGYYKAVVKEIRGLGFEFLLQAKGSHEKWWNPATGTILIIPRNLASRHTANAILKDAGSNKKY